MKSRSGRRRRRRSAALFSRRIAIAIAAVALVAIIAIALSNPWSTTESIVDAVIKPTSATLGLDDPLGAAFAGEIIAARAGIFERSGLKVELKVRGDDGDAIASVVNGSDTFGVVDGINFLMARANGQPIVAFAASFLESPVVFYALEKSGIHTPQDFIGRRVGRRPGTNSAILYDTLLRNTGVSRSQIRESTTETDLDALLNDRVDVIPGRIGQEGFLLRQKNVPFTVIRISDFGIHVPQKVYCTTEKLLRDRPSVALHFLQAVMAGWTMAYTDMAKSVPIITAAARDLTPEQVQFQLTAQRDFVMPVSRRVTEFDEQQWKQLRAILTTARLMDGSVDIGRAVNFEILKEAYRKPISFGN